ncbi:MAG: hypothetical protein HND47_04765 [Chloroflexi bacterium]|nr:hypothetical protein [Chloroflexota bacterium]
MDILKKLFSPAPRSPKRYYTFSVKCSRCGETIEGRVDLDNDLSVEYETGGDVYYARKVLIGESRCFQRVEVHFKFSQERRLLEREIIGGEFLSQ